MPILNTATNKCIHMYCIAKFKIRQIKQHSVLAEIAKFNGHQNFPLYGILVSHLCTVTILSFCTVTKPDTKACH